MAGLVDTPDNHKGNVALTPVGSKTKLIVGAGVGNFLEMFDFTVYSFFAAIIGHVFFNSEDKLISLLISVSVFGVGFVMRPLGSIIIGAYADRHGRKAAMLLTIVLMAIGSALIGFAPPYEAIGIFAPLLIVLGRLCQGFSAGGEVGAATTLLMESAERNKRGFFVSWQFFGQGLSTLSGSLLAALLMGCLSTEAMESWGWRVPFIFSLLIIPVGLYIRAHIKETYKAPTAEAHTIHPFKELISQHTKQTILGILMVFPSTVMMYILVFFMPNYLKTVTEIGNSQSFLVSSYASVIVIVVTVFAGFFCDRLERRKGAAVTVLAVTFISSYFAFHFVQNMHVFLAFYTVSMICMGLMLTLSVLFIIEAFEKRIRATATAVIYAFGVSIFGGTAQMIVTFLLKISDRNIMAPFWYLGVAIVVGMAAYLAFDEKRHEI
ncbi:MFS transporter [Bartonella choladocola]|uniref:Arabinose efflux permease, MFS family n=1 Tax=Bartonella choladocola TaxID=2750995 RepID=A0A1U9ME91_9HYPH|nr:MFS transporter [Bartonella choladocola]AQT46214.1 putative arabinose efflux permease, MFS family [Bartonella choladocola]